MTIKQACLTFFEAKKNDTEYFSPYGVITGSFWVELYSDATKEARQVLVKATQKQVSTACHSLHKEGKLEILKDKGKNLYRLIHNRPEWNGKEWITPTS